MHFEILVEDQSGKLMLSQLVPSILGNDHTFKVHSYKGIGRIPKGLKASSDPHKRILLDQLPRLLAGYGNTFAHYGPGYRAAVIVVCDLDRRSKDAFGAELAQMAANSSPCPAHAFCLAIEEGEAWFLGDVPAIKAAYPKAKDAVLSQYVNDSICGTWEVLANAVYPGGAATLDGQGWQRVGQEKSRWAAEITPNMELSRNRSPSFNHFMATLTTMALS